MSLTKQQAYTRYRSGVSSVPEQNKTSLDNTDAVHPDFVEVMSRKYPRVFDARNNLGLGETWDPIYKEQWMSKVYTVLYEQGVQNLGPSVQIFQMSRNVDITRTARESEFDPVTGATLINPTTGYDFNGITNDIIFDLWSLTSPINRVVLSNVVCEDHGDHFAFVDVQGTTAKPIEHRVTFKQIAVPSGKVVWQFEYKIKNVVRLKLHLTEIALN